MLGCQKGYPPKIACVKTSARHGPTRQGLDRAGKGPTPELTGPLLRSAELGSARAAIGLLAGGIIHPKACFLRCIPAAARTEGVVGRSIRGHKAELFTAPPQKPA